MFDISLIELLLVAVIALLVLGPERLPGAARTTGRWIGRVRRTVSRLSAELERELHADELRRSLQEETRRLETAAREAREAADAAAREIDRLETRPPPRSDSDGA